MDRRWTIFLIGVLLPVLVLVGCAPPQPPTDLPVTTKSDEARTLYLQARTLVDNMEPDKALPLIDRALTLDPDFALAYLLKAMASSGSVAARENREKAVALMGKVSPGERLLISYRDARATGKSAMARLYLDSLVASYPKDPHVQYAKGLYHFTRGESKEAIPHFVEATTLDTTFAAPYNNLGYAHMSLGNTADAEKAFTKYIRLMPNAPNPVDSYAEFLLLNGRYDESIQQYEKVLKMDPTFTGSLIGIGNCHIRKGDPATARQYYQSFLEKATGNTDRLMGHHWVAASYVYEGKIPEAAKALEQEKTLALELKENGAAVMSAAYEGFLQSMLGKPSDGIAKYKEATQLARDLQFTNEARDNYLTTSNMWMCFAYAEGKDLKSAEEAFGRYRKDIDRRQNPDDAEGLAMARGYLDIKQGRYDDALKEMSGVSETPLSHYLMATAYGKKGDKENATKMLEKLRGADGPSLDHAIFLKKATATTGK